MAPPIGKTFVYHGPAWVADSQVPVQIQGTYLVTGYQPETGAIIAQEAGPLSQGEVAVTVYIEADDLPDTL